MINKKQKNDYNTKTIEIMLIDENRMKGVDSAFSYITKKNSKKFLILGTACFLMGIASVPALRVIIGMLIK